MVSSLILDWNIEEGFIKSSCSMSVSVWSLKRKGSFHYLLPNISPYTPYISLVLSTLLFHTHDIYFRHLIFHTPQDVEYFVHEESTSLSLPCDDDGDILYQQMA